MRRLGSTPISPEPVRALEALSAINGWRIRTTWCPIRASVFVPVLFRYFFRRRVIWDEL